MDTIGPRIPEYAANAIDRLPGGPAAWRQRDFAEPAQEACRHRLLVLAAGKEIDKSLAESLSAGFEAADHVLSFTYTITATDTASYEACVALEALVRSRYQASTWFDPEYRLPPRGSARVALHGFTEMKAQELRNLATSLRV